MDHETARREGWKIRTAGSGSALTGGLPKPAAEPRAHTVTQGASARDAGSRSSDVSRGCCQSRKSLPERDAGRFARCCCASVCSSVRRTRVRGKKGSAHALPAWRRARSSRDLRKAARKAARRAQDCAKRRRRKCARAVMRRVMWNIKIYHSPGERAFLLQKTILCMKITQK